MLPTVALERKVKRYTGLVGSLGLWLGFFAMLTQPLYAQADPLLVDSNRFLGNAASNAVALGDLDNDGDLDAFVANWGQPNEIWLNQGQQQSGNSGSFVDSTQKLGDAYSSAVALGDLDGDGDLDAFVANGGASHGGSAEANVTWFNQGGVQQGTPAVFKQGDRLGSAESRGVALGDLDGDGDLDAFVINEGADQVWINQGGAQNWRPGFFQDSGQRLGNDDSWSVALGDLDGDGDLDAFVATIDVFDGSPNRIWLNQGGVQGGQAGEFADSGQALGNDGSWSVALGDLDGDGDLDAFVANGTRFGALDTANQVWINQGGAQGGENGTLIDSGQRLGDQNSRSVMVGDLDADGDLDAFVANAGGTPNRVWLNQGGRQAGTPSIFIAHPLPLENASNNIGSVALGDVDGDGDLDAFVAHSANQPNKLWLNQSAGYWQLGPALPTADHGRALALGDLDSDGDLDAFVARSDLGTGFADQIWLNQSGLQAGAPGLFLDSGQALGNAPGLAVALGDLDGDLDLDAFVVNQADFTIWLNQGGQQGGLVGRFLMSQQQSLESFDFQSVALGDLDGDGDLDAYIASGSIFISRDEYDTVWLNQGGLQGGVAATFMDSGQQLGSSSSTAVALGDLDGDGDLDAFVTNWSDESDTIWINQGSAQRGQSARFAESGQILGATWSSGVALGDLDGDGDLDAFVVNEFSQPDVVWLNQGGKQGGVAGHYLDSEQALGSSHSESVALADLDGDGDLDAFVSTSGPDTIWINQGKRQGGLPGAFSIGDQVDEELFGYMAALGDVDADGDVDALVATADLTNTLVLNPLADQSAWGITIQKPGATDLANFYATQEKLTDNLIEIPYSLYHPSGRPIARVVGYYSLDGGDNWQTAVAINTTTNLAASRTGVEHIFAWDVFQSGFFGQSKGMTFRLEAFIQPLPIARAGALYNTNGLPDLYLQPSVATATYPFWLQGTQIRVVANDGAGPPQGVRDALVYRFPPGEDRNATPLSMGLRTDERGYLQGSDRIEPGDHLVAMQPITATEKYTIYATSAQPGLAGLDSFEVTNTGLQTLTVSPQLPLILFNLTIALEWDARNDTQYLDDLLEDLHRTSTLLYDLSNGQAALGNLTLYYDKAHWLDADIRIYATNRLRPYAKVGGIISGLRVATTTRGDGAHQTLLFTPGQLHVGATWNRYGDVGETVGEDWARTLTHELGHYLFFLLDNYAGIEKTADGRERFVFVKGCRGIMSFPYDDLNSEFHPDDVAWQTDCAKTLSNYYMGRADWSNIASFYPMLKSTAVSIDDETQSGPNLLPLAVTQIIATPIISAPRTIDVPTFFLTQATGDSDQLYQPTGSARAFLLHNDRLLDLGTPRRDRLQVWNATPGDTLCVYDLAADPQPLTGCRTVNTLSADLTLRPQADWQPDLFITPQGTTAIKVQARNLPPGLALRARLYPAHDLAEIRPSATISLTWDANTLTYMGLIPTKHLWLEAFLHLYHQQPGTNVAGVDEYNQGVLLDYKLGSAPFVRLVNTWLTLADGSTLNLADGNSRQVGAGATLHLADGSILFISRDGLTLNLADGSTLNLADGSTLNLADGSTLNLADGNTLNLADGSTLNLADGGTLNLADGNTLNLADGSTLNLADGSIFQLTIGSTLNLADGSTLNLADGGTLNLADGNTPIRSGDGQVTLFVDNLNLRWGEFYTLQAISLIPNTPLWATVIGNAYAITTSATLTEPLHGSISFQYLGRDIAAQHEHLLHIYYYHDQRWQRLVTDIDPVHNLAVADAPGSGIYALMYSIEVPIAAPGWNLIAYPVQTSALITNGLASIDGAYATVYGYESAEPDEWQRWRVYDVEAPAYINTLDELAFGRGYWISVTEAITLYLKDLDVAVTHAAATNLALPPALYYGVLEIENRSQPTTDLAISAWIDGHLCGQGQSQLWQRQMVYQLVVSAAGENRAGCGAVGKSIQLQVDGQPLDLRLPWDNRRPQKVSLRISAPTVSEGTEERRIQLFLPIVSK